MSTDRARLNSTNIGTGTESGTAATGFPASLSRRIDQGIEGLWLLAVFLGPLTFLSRDVIWSEAIVGYFEVPKIALLRTLTALMVSLWLVQWGVAGHWPTRYVNPATWLGGLGRWLRQRPTNWVILSVWFYAGTTAITTILSGSFDVSLWGEVPGQDSFAAYTVLSYLVLFGMIASKLRNRKQLARLLGAIIIMGTLASAYGVLQHYGYDFLNALEDTGGGRSRVTVTMGNAIFAASVMLMSVLVSLTVANVTLSAPENQPAWLRRSNPQLAQPVLYIFWLLVISVQMLGLIFTFSRGPWVGTLLGIGAFLTLATLLIGWRVAARTVLLLSLSALIIMTWLQPGVLISLAGGTLQFWLLILATIFALALGLLLRWRYLAQLESGWQTLSRQPVIAPLAQRGRLSGTVGGLGLALALVGAIILIQFRVATGELSTSSEVGQRLGSISGQVKSGSFSKRGPIWVGSLKLMRDHPWFSFDDLSLRWLRPVIGYGPDLFRYTYLLVSQPADQSRIPLEPDHAHNYFIHQGVEQGLLGMASSLSIFVALFFATGYQVN